MRQWKRAANRALGVESPPCDRCGQPTGRPWLLRTPRTAWHCSGCEAQVMELLLTPTSTPTGRGDQPVSLR